MIHTKPHRFAGKTVTIKTGTLKGETYHLEDWWDRCAGQSWKFMQGNPACLGYAARTGFKDHVPSDDEVVYGKIGALGHLVHESELGEVVK